MPFQRKMTSEGWGLGILLFIVLISAIVFLGYVIFLQPFSPLVTSTPYPSLLPQNKNVPLSPFPSAQPFTIPIPDSNSLPTGETDVVCGHSLDIPFGSDPQLVVHRVKSGENINGFADEYETTVQAILSINHEIRIPIWENTPVVIPVGTTLVVGLPPFEVYEVSETAISPADLIQNLGTDLPSFLKYNDFDEACTIFSGWILIPRNKSDP